LSQTFGLHTVDNQPQHAAAPISARQQIASAVHIVVTFNFRFCAHYGFKSDIAACPKRAQGTEVNRVDTLNNGGVDFTLGCSTDRKHVQCKMVFASSESG